MTGETLAAPDVPYGLAPRVLVLTDDRGGTHEWERTIASSGGYTGPAVPLAAAATALDEALNVSLALLLLDAGSADSPALDPLLDRIEAAAASGRHPSIICLPAALIDRVAARIEHGEVTLLCDANRGEFAASLAVALSPREVAPLICDRDPEPMRLRQLSEEVERIARLLAALSGGGGPAGGGAAGPPPPAPGAAEPAEPLTAATVRATIRARRLRDQYFAAELFADPAWDMMLDLMAARLEGRQVAVSSLCIAAAVPATTALRWIKRLTDIGMFRRIADPRDGRRVFIELADASTDALTRYFAALARGGLAAG